MIVFSMIGCSAEDVGKKTLPDGLYLLNRVDTIESQKSALLPNEKEIFFSTMFEEYNAREYIRLIIDTTQFVPLDLEQSPVAEQQTEQKKKLMLSLTHEASEKLKDFSTDHVMDRVALVVDGEALTMHMIRVPLTSGQLQITRCNDNACERLFTTLKDNVKGN